MMIIFFLIPLKNQTLQNLNKFHKANKMKINKNTILETTMKK